MKTLYKLEENTKETSVALGFFDGVHIGHKKIIENAVENEKEGLVSVVLTFDKRPIEYFNTDKNKDISYLITNEDKEDIIRDLGISKLYFLDFLKIKELSAQEFVKDILVKKLNAKKVYCGFNYHFGKGGQATAQTLKEICCEYGIEVVTTKPVLYLDKVVSSTRIREALVNGEVIKANQMLGREFSYNFAIKKGNQIGRTIDKPTINQPFPQKFILPKFGVYASTVQIEDKIYSSVTNIGVKPTINQHTTPLSETWIPKVKLKEMYGEKIKVQLLEFIRAERKFDNIEQLEMQIAKDCEKSFEIFAKMMF